MRNHWVEKEKSMRGVHFTVLPASPCPAEFYEIWHTRSSHRRNHCMSNF